MNLEHLKIEFFCGTTIDRNGHPLPVRFVESAHAAAQRDLLAAFDGYSKTQLAGAWRGTKGVAHDTSTVYTVITPVNDGYVSSAKELKERFQAYFNQESVLLVITPVFAQF